LGGWTMPEYDLGKPTGVTLAPGPSGETLLWIADTHYHRVLAYPAEPREDNAAPEPVLSFGQYGESDGQFVYPTDVAVLTSDDGVAERIYVGEYGGNDRVSVYDACGDFLLSFGQFGSSAEPDQIEFNRPQAAVVAQTRREVLVADACNHRIGRFTPEGQLIAWIGSPDTPGDGPGQFRYPYGLSLLDDGTLLVA